MEGKIVTSGQPSVDARRLVLGVIHVLVVDDDPVCLAIVAAVLRACKYNVMSVKNSIGALSFLRTNRDLIDLVITDVHMPGMNGFELQKFIDQEFKLPVIMMSADSRENIMFKGLEGGASFFMVKPIKQEDVRDIWQFAVAKKKGKAPITAKEAVNPDPEVSPFALKRASHDDDNIVLGTSSSSTNQGKGEEVRKKREYKRRTPQKSIVSTCGVNNASKTIKKTKVIWTTTLHSRFLLAIQEIGLTKCVPKRILEVMSVPGLTRENVASHLQKYRIFLKRVSNTSDEMARKMVERVLLRSSFALRHGSSFFNSFQQNYVHPGLPNNNQEALRSPFATNSQATLLQNNHIYQPSNFSRLGLMNHPNGIRIGDVSSPNANGYLSRFTMNNGSNNPTPMPQVSNIGLITSSANTMQGLMMNRNNNYTTNGFGVAENNIGSSSNNPSGSNYIDNNYGVQVNNYGGQFGNNDQMLGNNYVGYQATQSNGGFVPNNGVQQSEEEEDDGIDYSNVFGFIDNNFSNSNTDFSQPWNDDRLNAMFLAEINGKDYLDKEGDEEETMEPDLFADSYHVEVPEEVVQPLNQGSEEVSSCLADDIMKWFDLQPPNEDELGEEFVNSMLNGMNQVGDDEVEDPFDWVDVADDDPAE